MSDDPNPTPAELERALPAPPIDASLRMRVQRAARASYERTPESSTLVWQDALVPAMLVLTGLVYGAGALAKLAEIFG